MLTGGKWGEASCAHCNRSLGAAITCPHCGFINAHVDSDDKSTNLCQNSTELVETAETISARHRYAGSFGE